MAREFFLDTNSETTQLDPCNKNPDLFYPEKENKATTAAAKLVCRVCVNREACLENALENEEPKGVWGGLNTRERRKILKEMGRMAS